MLSYRVEIPPRRRLYGRGDKMVMWGSCFAQELRKYLYEGLYDVEGAPYGIIYNPISMATALKQLLDSRLPKEEDLFFHLNEWHSPMHHGDYSHTDKALAHKKMIGDFRKANQEISSASLFVFTFGTAFLYEDIESGAVVSNCHRLPSARFSRRRASVDEIVAAWVPLLGRLYELNPDAEVILTVSPICHYRDGAHENRLSKAVLHLACEELCGAGAHYFPSYEIMQDELRDYRFYKDDYAHPSDQAVYYIMDRFSSAYLYNGEQEQVITREWNAIRALLHHRPLTTHTPSILAHYERCLDRISVFQKQFNHPYICEQEDLLKKKIEELLCHG